MKYEVTKPEAEWKEQLTPLQYRVTREKHTEPPFTGVYYDHKGTGMYVCVACGAELFSSGTKYDSGCGWPSFWKPAEGAGIEEAPDTSHGMKRTEILCSRCGAHLGHLFEDGPQPTGLRYCVNSASLTFRETQSQADAPGKEGETEEVK